MIHDNILEIQENFDVYIFDAYGVFNFGGRLSSDALGVMEALVKEGKKLYILSNSTKIVEKTMGKYARHGLFQNVHYHGLLTSGQYALDMIRAGTLGVAGKKVYVIGQADTYHPEIKIPQIFAGSGYEMVPEIKDADFAYCGSPRIDNRDMTDIEAFRRPMMLMKDAGLPLLCANPDCWSFEGGRLVVRPGAVAAEYERAGGRVVYYGKPDILVFKWILNAAGNPDGGKVLMVGDTLATDILGANRAGIKSCLVLANGVTENMISERGWEVTEENIAVLAETCGAQPDYTARRV